MTLEEASAQVSLLTDASADPEVTSEEVETVLAGCRLEDGEGLAPTDPAWAGVYDLELACARVFEIKASRVSGRFDFAADGASYKRSQTPDFFRERAREHRKRRAASFFEETTTE